MTYMAVPNQGPVGELDALAHLHELGHVLLQLLVVVIQLVDDARQDLIQEDTLSRCEYNRALEEYWWT